MNRSNSLIRAHAVARGVLLLASGLVLLFGTSAAFVGEATDDSVLASTFGVGMGLFGIVLTLVAFAGERRAWFALWYLPVFFSIHVATFGTWVPDAPLCALTAWALLASRASERDGTGRDSERLRPRPYEAGLVGEHHGLGAVSQSELRQHVSDVRLDRGLAQHELGRDLGVRAALGDQREHVTLTRRQLMQLFRSVPLWRRAVDELLDEPSRDRGRGTARRPRRRSRIAGASCSGGVLLSR